MAFKVDDSYVDVAERIREFTAKYPEGTLQSHVEPRVVEVGGKCFIVYGAAAYRTPDDPRPGIGWAWEPVPGPTNFTKDSELQNAETSAWGRAIVALGFATKKIASRQEVENRRAADDVPVDLKQKVTPRWETIREIVEGYGDPVVQDFKAFGDAATPHLDGMTLLQGSMKVVTAINDEFPPGAFPPPAPADWQREWAKVLGGVVLEVEVGEAALSREQQDALDEIATRVDEEVPL